MFKSGNTKGSLQCGWGVEIDAAYIRSVYFIILVDFTFQNCQSIHDLNIKLPQWSSIKIHIRLKLSVNLSPGDPDNTTLLPQQDKSPKDRDKFLLPVTDQLLTPSGGNPDIGTGNCAICDVTCGHTNSKGKNDNNGVGTGVGEPDVVLKFGPVGWHVLVEVGTRFGREGTAAGGSGP